MVAGYQVSFVLAGISMSIGSEGIVVVARMPHCEKRKSQD